MFNEYIDCEECADCSEYTEGEECADCLECTNEGCEEYTNHEDQYVSAMQLAVALGFAEEIADAERIELKFDTERSLSNNAGGIEMISLKEEKVDKINLQQRDPHFLAYVKEVCHNNRNIDSYITTSWKDIF